MTRIDITGFISDEIINKLDLRPSVKERIDDCLFANDIRYVRSLCMMTEEELLSIHGLDIDMIQSLKDYLQTVGLHFGMSYDELTYYQDADYLEELAHKDEPKQDNRKKPNDSDTVVTEDGYIRIKEEKWRNLNDEKDKLEKKANRWGLFIPWSTLFFIVLIIPPAFSVGYFIHRTFFSETTTSSKEYTLPEDDDERMKRLEDKYCHYPDSSYSD